MNKLITWFLSLFKKKIEPLDSNLLKGYWLFNVDKKQIKVLSDKNFLEELKASNIEPFKEIIIEPNTYAYIPYKVVEYVVDGSVSAHMALDRATKTKYARRFNCKPITKLRVV